MSRVRVVDLPSGDVAVTVSCHFPVDRPSGVSNEPSASTLTVFGPTFAPLPPAGRDGGRLALDRAGVHGGHRDGRRVGGGSLDRDRAVLELRAIGGRVDRERRRLEHDERHRDEHLLGVLRRLHRLGVDRVDRELVATAAELDVGGPAARGVGRHAVRLLARGLLDRDRRLGRRRARERELRRVLPHLDDRGDGRGHGERRRLGEPDELDAEVHREHADEDRQQRRDDDDGRERQALARRLERARHVEDGLVLARACRRPRGATGGRPRPGQARGTARSCAGSPSCTRRPAARRSRRPRAPGGSATRIFVSRSAR